MKQKIYNLLLAATKFVRSNRILYWTLYNPFHRCLKRRLASFDYVLYSRVATKEVSGDVPYHYLPSARSKYKIGILRDPFCMHENYCTACMELGVAYEIIDWLASDWINRIRNSQCDAFVSWPGESIREWKNLFDDRLRFLENDMGKVVYPSPNALWLYGSKERQQSWLEIYGYPHPATWIFYEKDEALDFIHNYQGLDIKGKRGRIGCLVAKVDIGASAKGVKIIHTKKEAKNYVEEAFSGGLPGGVYANPQTRQWRHVLFQEHVGEAKEWRVMRLGESYFAYGKGKKGEFHSGSGIGVWDAPSQKLLNLLHDVTEKCRTSSMSMDVFELPNGELLINEMQCIYGAVDPAQMYVDGIPGRFLRHEDGQYEFQEGVYCTHHGCLLRVKDLIKILEEK